jgi:histidinol-phosphate aminotransferase
MTTTPDPTRYAAPPSPAALAARLGVPIERICKLDANESPYGPPPKALAALARLSEAGAGMAGTGRYPDPYGDELRAALAVYTSVPAAGIALGNGSDDLIYRLTELLARPGDEIVVSEPTFSVFAIAARQRGGVVVDTGRDADFGIAPEALAAAITPRTRLVYLCAPNNPTGTALPHAVLRAALARAEALGGPEGAPLVVTDEAYYEIGALAGDAAVWSAAPLVAEGRPLAVLRTFSKVFGLAGLRVGYLLGAPALAGRLRARQPYYHVNLAAQLAARAALDDLGWLRERAAALVRGRATLAAALGALPGLRVYPSAANFLLVACAAGQRDALWAGLLDRGILTRRFETPRLADCLRITVGTPEEHARLLAALRELLAAEARP